MILVSGATKTVARLKDPRIGVLLRPGNGNRPTDKPWACDNAAYGGKFNPIDFRKMLARFVGIPGCLWVACPDVVGDASATRALFDQWEPEIAAMGFPVAFVLQDGQRAEDVPWNRMRCAFVGGSTRFKLGPEARALTDEARRRGSLVHVGRVNSLRRFGHCQRIGADSLDGTQFSMFAETWLPRAIAWLDRLEHQQAAQSSLWERL